MALDVEKDEPLFSNHYGTWDDAPPVSASFDFYRDRVRRERENSDVRLNSEEPGQ